MPATQMTSIWSPETKFRIWFEIEAHATDALAELGVVPKEAAAKIWEMGRDAKFDVARIDAIEAKSNMTSSPSSPICRKSWDRKRALCIRA